MCRGSKLTYSPGRMKLIDSLGKQQHELGETKLTVSFEASH